MKKLFAVLIVSLMILSCGGGKKTGDSKESKEGTTVTLNFTQEAESIDPQLTTDTVGTKTNALISEGLTRQDEKGAPVAGIAEKWETSEDGLVWTFHLRENAKWENGEPITANDFKFAWLRALDPNVAARYAYMFYMIKGAEEYNIGKGSKEEVGIKVVDDKTLEVTLKSPTAYFPAIICYQTFAPLNEKFYNRYKGQYATEVGKILSSGPYKLVSWTRNEGSTYIKNENYWDKDRIKINNVEIKMISDPEAALQAFNNGKLDVVPLNTMQYEKYKNDSRLTFYDDGSAWYLLFNTKKGILKNKKIRQAFTLAIDKKELTKMLGKTGEPAYGIIPPFVQGAEKAFREEAGNTYTEYNPEKSKKLLVDGLKELKLDEVPEMFLFIDDRGSNLVIAQYVQRKIKKELGVGISLEIVPFSERIDRMKQSNFDIVLGGWSADYNDALSYMDLYMTGNGNNYTSFTNAKYDELLKIAQTSPDQKARITAMIEAEKILGDEMPIGMLYFRKQAVVINPRLKNMKFKAVGSEYYIHDAYIEE